MDHRPTRGNGMTGRPRRRPPVTPAPTPTNPAHTDRLDQDLGLRIAAVTSPGPIWYSPIADEDNPATIFGWAWVTARSDTRRGGLLYNLENQAAAPQAVRDVAARCYAIATDDTGEHAEQTLDWLWQNPPAGITIGYRARTTGLGDLYRIAGRANELGLPSATRDSIGETIDD